MRNFLYKTALQVAIPALCGLILLNAYLVSRNLTQLQRSADLRAGASQLQAEISSTASDLQTMETSQRGYLLTGDPSYLRPYNEAGERLQGHFADLRSRLTGKDLALEGKLESSAQAKLAEMKETIHLRQEGYRHRAFVIVDSNRGRDLMEEARASLDALASAQGRTAASFDRELRESVSRAYRQSASAGSMLLLVALVTWFVFHRYRTRLELGYARHDEKLRAATLQLETLSSTIFADCRTLLAEVRNDAGALLEAYGSFLPRQGHQAVEQIEAGAGQMISRMEDLSKTLPGNPARNGAVQPLQSLSA